MTVCTKLQQTLWIHDNDECHRFFGARQFSTQQQTSWADHEDEYFVLVTSKGVK